MSDGLAYAISLEGLGVSTSGLADPDEFGRTARMTAEGGALQARARWRGTRAELRLQMRSLTLLEQPNLGFPRYYPLPRGIDTQSEYSGSLSADHTFVATHLTVGAGMDVVSPAAFSTVATEGGSPVPTRLVVVASANSFDVLPTGVGSSAWWRARLYGRWDVDHFSAVAEAFLRDDPNLTKFKDNFQGVSEPILDPSTAVGFNLLLQARFP